MARWNQLNDTDLTKEQRKQLISQVVQVIQRDDYSFNQLRDREWLGKKADEVVRNEVARSSFAVPAPMLDEISKAAVAMVGGLGFVHELLPPVRNDLSEVSVDAEGRVWLMAKQDTHFHLHDYQPSPDEVWRAVEALLAHSGQAISRAIPSVDAKLPRSAGMGGARIKVIHPSVAPGLGYPLFNVRLFEPKPVRLEQLLTWKVAPRLILERLQKVVTEGFRVLIAGGTYTGKTTLLSALANAIPKDARVLKIEDPEEIWIEHPHVISLEARDAPPGSDIPGYGMTDGVNDGMRLSPRWLIVGEVRKGGAALDLFSAQMSGHPGLSTFHARSPEEAAERISLMMFMDRGVELEAARNFFVSAVDVVLQLGWIGGQRKLLGMWGVNERLHEDKVVFEDIWVADDYQQGQKTNRIQDLTQIMEGN
ncbi:MAG: ATPase, T2SS/T4P/T4SS family [Chloroflexota bacterium]|nr:ATPase, T2SS/T4P/T4SS family [Chloroflexota bacterium]